MKDISNHVKWAKANGDCMICGETHEKIQTVSEALDTCDGLDHRFGHGTCSKCNPKPDWCIICKRKTCEQMRARRTAGKEADYCCLDIPIKYITKPIRAWLCKPCARQQTRYWRKGL